MSSAEEENSDSSPTSPTASSSASSVIAASTFRILVATDNHVGYLEKDPIRGNDSFESFEEILQIATDEEVLNPFPYQWNDFLAKERAYVRPSKPFWRKPSIYHWYCWSINLYRCFVCWSLVVVFDTVMFDILPASFLEIYNCHSPSIHLSRWTFSFLVATSFTTTNPLEAPSIA